jgi:hypothetical protein
MDSIAVVLYILIDLSRTIKNEWIGSIATVLLSAFNLTNTEDPDTSPATENTIFALQALSLSST